MISQCSIHPFKEHRYIYLRYQRDLREKKRRKLFMRATRACICEICEKKRTVKSNYPGKRFEENLQVKGEMAKSFNAEPTKVCAKLAKFLRAQRRISQCSIHPFKEHRYIYLRDQRDKREKTLRLCGFARKLICEISEKKRGVSSLCEQGEYASAQSAGICEKKKPR